MNADRVVEHNGTVDVYYFGTAGQFVVVSSDSDGRSIMFVDRSRGYAHVEDIAESIDPDSRIEKFLTTGVH